jgi:parallel beta-helix repeat protein
MKERLKCPVCGWEGESESCPNCKFPLEKFRPLLSGERVLYNEGLAEEFEALVQKHEVIFRKKLSIDLAVAPDGSGDDPSLEDAVKQAKTGATIYLKAGIHRLSHPLLINKALSLIGKGIDKTFVVCDGEEYVVKFSGDGQFSASDISFVHEGPRWAHVVEVASGQVSLIRCRFKGGVYGELSKRGGIGLFLYGTVRGQVKACEIVGNGACGIYVGEQANPILEGNTCNENKWSGIAYLNNASGTARNNTCIANERYGIYVDKQANPMLEGNTCNENKWSGIAYFGNASGIARNNTCIANEGDGIYVGEQANPILEGNTCNENKESGIAYHDNASGIAINNTCIANGVGIYVDEQASPILEGNTCKENKWGDKND